MSAAEAAFDPTLKDDLESGDLFEVWNQGKTRQKDNEPEGTFQVEIASAVFGRSQGSDRPQITYELVVLSGPAKGKSLRKYDGLGSDQQCQISQSQLTNLGIDAKSLTLKQLPAALVSLAGKKATVKAKHNGDFYNIYFQRAITPAKQSKPATAAKSVL